MPMRRTITAKRKEQPAPSPTERANLSSRLRAIRRERKLTLSQASEMTGLSVSTLSKVENNQMSLTYDSFVKLAQGLGIEIAALFDAPVEGPQYGRRAVTSRGQGSIHRGQNYVYELLCTELSAKRMVPMLTHVRARSLEAFGPLIRHEGEEFIFVLKGPIIVYTDCYEPLQLNDGDSLYIDSRMGHAYVAACPGDGLILGVCSHRQMAGPSGDH